LLNQHLPNELASFRTFASSRLFNAAALDTTFVAAFHNPPTSIAEELRLLLTTPRLLANFAVQATLAPLHMPSLHCSDGTYKLNWNGWPLLFAGTQDFEHTCDRKMIKQNDRFPLNLTIENFARAGFIPAR
jgi:hypothetical protein